MASPTINALSPLLARPGSEVTALILLSDFQKTEIELWRPVANCYGYEVSNLGRIRSFLLPKRSGYRDKQRYGYRATPLIMKRTVIWSGYLRVALRVNHRYRYLAVHRLVAQAFIPNPDNLPEANHITGLKSNCRAGNLEWSTSSGNKLHAARTGLAGGEKHGMARLTEDDVRAIRRRGAEGETGVAIALDLGVTSANVYYILKRRTWKYVT